MTTTAGRVRREEPGALPATARQAVYPPGTPSAGTIGIGRQPMSIALMGFSESVTGPSWPYKHFEWKGFRAYE